MGIDEGWIFGEWETGPWLGFRSTEKEAGSYSWLGFGDGAGGDHMVSLYSSMNVNAVSGVEAHLCLHRLLGRSDSLLREWPEAVRKDWCKGKLANSCNDHICRWWIIIPQFQDIQKTYAASRKKMDIVTVGWDYLHFCSLAIFLCIWEFKT